MLATDAHGGSGGIAQYNRDVLEAMSASDRIEQIVVLARRINDARFSAPDKVTYDLSSASGLYSFIGRCLRRILMGSRFDLVYCAHINLLPVAILAGRLRRVPVVLAIYGIDAWQPPSGHAARWASRFPTLIISISDTTLRRFRVWARVDEARASVVPNAIRAERYGVGDKNESLMHRFGLSGRKVIMTFGRMSPDERYKGFDEIIDLLPALRTENPDLVYLAAGDGPDRPRLEAKARELEVADMVVFTGYVPEEQKPDYYRLADAYVMPSSGEGFGFVVIEALACGLPVVASRADGTQEAVRYGKLGLVVDPANRAELQDAILAALTWPRRVPAGIEYFSFSKFSERLQAAISRAVDLHKGTAS